MYLPLAIDHHSAACGGSVLTDASKQDAAKSMDLSSLFNPRSIAIVGANNDTQRLGGGIVLQFL